MDMMDVCIEVKKNENGFIPTTIHLSSSTKEIIFIHVDPVFEAVPHICYMHEKHGEIPWLARGSRSMMLTRPIPIHKGQTSHHWLKILMEDNSIGKTIYKKPFLPLTHQDQVLFWPSPHASLYLHLKSLESRALLGKEPAFNWPLLPLPITYHIGPLRQVSFTIGYNIITPFHRHPFFSFPSFISTAESTTPSSSSLASVSNNSPAIASKLSTLPPLSFSPPISTIPTPSPCTIYQLLTTCFFLNLHQHLWRPSSKDPYPSSLDQPTNHNPRSFSKINISCVPSSSTLKTVSCQGAKQSTAIIAFPSDVDSEANLSSPMPYSHLSTRTFGTWEMNGMIF